MLREQNVAYTYRDYVKTPLDEAEIRTVLRQLDVGPRAILRGRDAKVAGIPSDLDDDALITAMAANPSLLQRPIAVKGDKAVVGRPFERVLEVV